MKSLVASGFTRLESTVQISLALAAAKSAPSLSRKNLKLTKKRNQSNCNQSLQLPTKALSITIKMTTVGPWLKLINTRPRSMSCQMCALQRATQSLPTNSTTLLNNSMVLISSLMKNKRCMKRYQRIVPMRMTAAKFLVTSPFTTHIAS